MAKPKPWSRTFGARLVTKVPSPRRTSSTCAVSSAFTASRSELRDMPRSLASCGSDGNRDPGRRLPDWMSARILLIASSVSATEFLPRACHAQPSSAANLAPARAGSCQPGGRRALVGLQATTGAGWPARPTFVNLVLGLLLLMGLLA
jgi:hypothetical protein